MTILDNIYPSGSENGNVYSVNDLSPTIKAGTGVKGNGIGSSNAPKILNIEKIALSKEQRPMIAANLATSNLSRIPHITPTDIATTLLARDYKGLSNHGSNIVMEIEHGED